MLWVIACGSPGGPSGRIVSLDARDNGRIVAVQRGDEIDVTLQTIGPGEYNEVPDVSTGAVVFLKESLPGLQNPGGPRQLFQFSAAAVGLAVISIPHTWQNSRFEITVDVR